VEDHFQKRVRQVKRRKSYGYTKQLMQPF
jgi:hypothetical protein